MNNRFFLFVCFLCGSMLMKAQTGPSLPDVNEVWLPRILQETETPHEDELRRTFTKDSDWGQTKTRNKDKKVWKALSDRDNNPTYMTADAKDKYATLSLGEEVCIAEIKNNMALVYVDPNADSNYPKTNVDGIVSKGWIPMDKLLLWEWCPCDSRSIRKKALIAINLNKAATPSEMLDDKVYKNPEELKGGESLQMDMNFYYVMKISGEWALLCKQARASRVELYGWVHNTAYTPWNQRTCLEPNWAPEYVEGVKGKSAEVLGTDKKSPVAQWHFGTMNNVDDEYDMFRMDPNMLRFPVLDKVDEQGMIKCTAFANKGGYAHNASKYSNVAYDVNEAKEAMRQMNIILVIEASDGMAEYFPAVQEALDTCKSYFQQGINVQVGLVLYRDLASGIASNDIISLCKYDDVRLKTKLKSSEATKTKLTGEKYVSLAQAIETAASPLKMGFDTDQSNFVLLIGCHGTKTNDKDCWNEKNLLDLLSSNKINIASIQTQRSGVGSILYYTNLISDLVVANVKRQYENIGGNWDCKFKPLKGNTGYVYTSNKEKQDNDGSLYSIKYASIRNGKDSGKGGQMTADELKELIYDTINGFSESINDKSDYFGKALQDIQFDQEFVTSILGEKKFEQWKQLKLISAYSGYAKVNDLGPEDPWKAIIFLDNGELEELVELLSKVKKAADERDDDRKVFINAMRDLIKVQMGGSVSNDEIDNIGIEDLGETIYGMANIPSESIKGKGKIYEHSLTDIASPDIVSDEEYRNILHKFCKNYDRLSGYLEKDEYKFSMEVFNGHDSMILYYWIPLEDLP